MKISSLLLVVSFALAAPFVGAAQGDPGTQGKPSIEELKRNIERWKALPQAERDRLKQNWRQVQSFRPEQAVAVQENFRKFQNLTAERRAELSKKWKDLPAQQREVFAQKLRELQQMGPDRRRMALEFARMAHSLTPEQKRQLEQASTPEEKRQILAQAFRGHVLRQYAEGLSPEERKAFEAAPREEQKRRLQKFFRERVMRGPPGERGGPR